jgi:DNA repair exonuclease SbcCD ATPase subunit
MKLRLKNFRCYPEKEFDFGEDGLLLLSGSSGAGKSSLLMSITFVLYGTGTKLTSFGKTSCSVEMEFDNLKILRTKRPNHVTVTNMLTNEEFEDETAQGVINERFGTAFEITSYLQQNAVNSFILMSPLEKLAFLEKFAFQGTDLTQIKGRCASIIKKRNEELIGATSQLEMAENHFQSMIKPEKVPFPFKTKDRELKIKNENIRHKNNTILIRRTERSLEKLKEEYNSLKLFLVKLEAKNTIISTSKRKIDQITEEQSKLTYEGDEALADYEKQLASVLSRRELMLLQDRYDQDMERMKTMKEAEMVEIQKEIKNIEGKLWKEYKSEEITTTLAEYQQLIRDADSLERLKKNAEKYKTDISEEKLLEKIQEIEDARNTLVDKKATLAKLILQKELYQCPSCHVSLKFQDDTLHLANVNLEEDNEETIDIVTEQIRQLERNINHLERMIPEEQNKHKRLSEIMKEIDTLQSQYEGDMMSKNEAETNMEYLKDYKRSQQELEKRKKNLESNKTPSLSVQTFMNQINTEKEAIKALKEKLGKNKSSENIDEEELRVTIQTQRQNKEKIDSYAKQVKILTREMNLALQEVKELEEEYSRKYTEIKDPVLMEQEISVQSNELKDLQGKLQEADLNMKKIEAYQKYKEELDRYTEWETKTKELSTVELKCRQQYSAATLLKDKILEAESLAILNVINSINIHAQEYLDLFFPDHPIVVRLLPFKTTKKKTTKPQINIEIDYKGMEADINMLSGGELSRVVLAYTLALSEIFNAPMIMLDECTSSLDAELTSTVMEGIKKNFGNKLVVIIAHQVIEGDFDRQIAL